MAVVDILRRGNVAVQTVSIMDSLEVKSAHGVTVKADRLLREVDGNDADALICPGGLPGAEHLGNCEALIGLLQRQYDRGGLVAAICAAPALVLIDKLTEAGAEVKAYDPIAMNECKRRIGDKISYASDMYDAVLDADALLMVTEWKEFRLPSWSIIHRAMRQHFIVDGRNIYDAADLAEEGFVYHCIGL